MGICKSSDGLCDERDGGGFSHGYTPTQTCIHAYDEEDVYGISYFILFCQVDN